MDSKSAPLEGVAPGALRSGGGGLWLEVRSLTYNWKFPGYNCATLLNCFVVLLLTKEVSIAYNGLCVGLFLCKQTLGTQKLTQSDLNGVLKTNVLFFETLLSYKSPIPERRKLFANSLPTFTSKKRPVLNPLQTGPDQFSTPEKIAGLLYHH